MSKDDKNRAIAEWLEPEPKWTCGNLTTGKAYTFNPFVELEDSLTPRDFITSEEASALVLEKMSDVNAYVWIEWDINEWCISWLPTTAEDQDPPVEYSNRDRKTAIAEAALALIQQQKVAK